MQNRQEPSTGAKALIAEGRRCHVQLAEAVLDGRVKQHLYRCRCRARLAGWAFGGVGPWTHQWCLVHIGREQGSTASFVLSRSLAHLG